MSSPPPDSPLQVLSPRRTLIGVVEAGVLVTAVATILGFFGRWHWALDLFSHFRGQYFVALSAATLVLAAVRRPVTAGIAAAGVVANAILLAPLFFSASKQPAPAESPLSPPLSVVTLNVLYRNPGTTPTLDWLRASSADIVFLSEVTPKWSAALKTLDDLYPHQEHRPQNDPFGCAVLSKRPWLGVEEKTFGPFDAPSLVVRFEWHQREIVLVGMHPPPPNSGAAAAYRDAALDEAATFLDWSKVRRQLLVGDLNATPWSHAFQSVTRRAELVDTALGHGWQPTWNVGRPLFQIPLDHILVSDGFQVVERTIGPDLGSDHRAVRVVLRVQ